MIWCSLQTAHPNITYNFQPWPIATIIALDMYWTCPLWTTMILLWRVADHDINEKKSKFCPTPKATSLSVWIDCIDKNLSKWEKYSLVPATSWSGFELLLGGLTACVHFPTTIPVVEMAGQSKVLNWSSASQKKKCLNIFDADSSNYARKDFSSIRTFLFF